jgi:hypothetical protein
MSGIARKRVQSYELNEEENVVPLSVNITVGATQTNDVNIHEMATN